jgi:hypothetical protein
MNFIALLSEPKTVNTSATANIENYCGWRGQVATEKFLGSD